MKTFYKSPEISVAKIALDTFCMAGVSVVDDDHGGTTGEGSQKVAARRLYV